MNRQRAEIVIPIRTLFAVAVFAALAASIVAARALLLSILVAGVLSLGLDPLVGALVSRGWRRGRAALLVFASVLVPVVLVATVTVNPLWSEVRMFARDLPGYWNELARNAALKPLLGRLNERSVDADRSVAGPRRERMATLLRGRAPAHLSCRSELLGHHADQHRGEIEK